MLIKFKIKLNKILLNLKNKKIYNIFNNIIIDYYYNNKEKNKKHLKLNSYRINKLIY